MCTWARTFFLREVSSSLEIMWKTGFLPHLSCQHFANILHCFPSAQLRASAGGQSRSPYSWRDLAVAPGGPLEQQALSVVNGSEKALVKTGSPLPDLWLAMQQTVSHVTSRDISIFMATVQVYFSHKYWKIWNKKSKWIYDTRDVVCELPGRSCVLIPCGQGWMVILLSYLCFLSSTSSKYIFLAYNTAKVNIKKIKHLCVKRIKVFSHLHLKLPYGHQFSDTDLSSVWMKSVYPCLGVKQANCMNKICKENEPNGGFSWTVSVAMFMEEPIRYNWLTH